MWVWWCLLWVSSPNAGPLVRYVLELLHRTLEKALLCKLLEDEDALWLPTVPLTPCPLPTSWSLTVQYKCILHPRENPSGVLLCHCSFFWTIIADCSSQILQISLGEKPGSHFSFSKSHFTAFFSDSNSKLGLMHSHFSTRLQQGSQPPLFVVTSNCYNWFSLCPTRLAWGGSSGLYFSKFRRT